MEKQLEELKQLQDENFKKLSLLEDSLREKFIPEEDELYITERKVKKDDLVLPKLSDDCNVTKAENIELPPINRPSSSSSNCSSKLNKAKSPPCKSPNVEPVKEEKKHKEVNQQVDELLSHYRRDGYGNKPWIGNKPTSFEYEKMKKLPSSKTNIKVRLK